MRDYTAVRPEAVCDTECLNGYWSIGFKTVDGGKTRVFEKYDGVDLDRTAIAAIFRKYRVFTFNGIKYDIPMILYAMSGASCEELQDASRELIVYGTPHWQLMERLGLTIPDFIDHVDLMQVSPGAPQMPSLKLYAGRLHSKRMQEMPVGFDEPVGPAQRDLIRPYHGNDMDVTIDMLNDLRDQLKLRALMSVQYGVDLRSKSDPQVAEAVMKAEIERIKGEKVWKPDIVPGSFKYKVPTWARFKSEPMIRALAAIESATFGINHAGQVVAPDEVAEQKVTLGRSTYKMGLGGLHSTEKSVTYYSDEKYVLKDRDVTSYYPMSILLQRMYPTHLGPVFLEIFQKIFDRRVAAKRAGDKNTAETLKIVLNGVFGKLGNAYSIFYSPNLMIQVTLSGQLAILMLIERLEMAGINVISGNTDGIVSRVPRELVPVFEKVIDEWEWDTGYMTEETEYLSLHSRDVNNYIAIAEEKGKRKVKTKGDFGACGPGLPGAAGQKKNPNMQVSTDAAVAYLTDGTPIEDTVEWEFDARKFVVVKRVNGGAQKDGQYLGKALRWYYAKGVSGGFHRQDNGNSVPETIGAKLLMELPKYVPDDVDRDYYVREAYAILQDVGARVEDPRLKGRTGTFMGRLEKFKSVHVVDASSGVAICGKTRESIRDSWIHYEEIPNGLKLCLKCKKVMGTGKGDDL